MPVPQSSNDLPFGRSLSLYMGDDDMGYILGLDVGIASVGWAALLTNGEGEPIRILDLNSRIFPQAEAPKTGASLALPRRQARGARRRLRRRRHRIERTRNFLVRIGMLTEEKAEALYDHAPQFDVYTLRYQGLERLLNPEEWARVLLYFVKHRGFKSNRKNLPKGNEEGRVLEAVRANSEILKQYRTVGEMLYKDEKFRYIKRNKADDYRLTVSRDMLEAEIRELFAAQESHGNQFATEKLMKGYLQLFLSQRNFDEGPGGDSPYGGDQILKMVGKCELEKTEPRAPRACYTVMRCVLRQKINHLRLHSNSGYRQLTSEEQQTVESMAWRVNTLSYDRIRKELDIGSEWTFAGLSYGSAKSDDIEKTEKKTKLMDLSPYHTIRKALDKVKKKHIEDFTYMQLDQIGEVFTFYKNDARIVEKLSEYGFKEEDIKALLSGITGFSKVGHLSLKACRKIQPYLDQGMDYRNACEKAHYDMSEQEGRRSLQEELQEVTNPVVRRAVSQTLKVVKAVSKRYGAPIKVHIELARELARNFQDRKKLKKKMEENQSHNEQIKDELKKLGMHAPKGLDIVKYKLYKEQQGICAYSQRPIDAQEFINNPSIVEVDHILPYSRSLDDNYANKVLVYASENRQKGNRTPLEYMESLGDEKRMDSFVAWARTIRDKSKRDRLLSQNYADRQKDWKERHLQDTKYISRFLYNILRKYLPMSAPEGGHKQQVFAVNGAVTGYVRKRLGIQKIRENGDLHHAVDAAIIATVTPGMIQRISRYSEGREESKSKHFPEPWPSFVKELDARVSRNPSELISALHLPNYSSEEIQDLKPCFVSRMPNHKVHGAAHEETIRSRCGGLVITKTKLTALKLDNGEIENYYNPDSDRLLYNALLARLNEYDGKADKAFADEFHKPKSDGTPGPVVKKVKLAEPATLTVDVGRGAAANGRCVRIDVFHITEGKEKGFYMVPIYVADVVKENLPLKAVVARKPYDDWKEMSPEDFIFSLYPNDLVYVKHKRSFMLTLNKDYRGKSTLANEKIQRNEAFLYYQGADISTGAMKLINDDGAYEIPGLGLKTLVDIQKWSVDVLGNRRRIKKESRQTFK